MLDFFYCGRLARMPYIKVRCNRCYGRKKSVYGYGCLSCNGRGFKEEYIYHPSESHSSSKVDEFVFLKLLLLILFFVPFGMAYLLWRYLDRIVAILYIVAFFTGHLKFEILFALSIVLIFARSIELLLRSIKKRPKKGR